jgi:7,8-dihydroneopterin aldolase/epimerase/oxygenase
MDRILLSGITCLAKVGVSDLERQLGCPCEIDLEIGFDLAKSARSDQLEDTLDYAALHRDVVRLAEECHFTLLERLAEEMTRLVLSRAGVKDVRLRLKKTGIPGMGGLKHAAVQIHRKNT